MIEFRAFLNTDPPRIVEIWRGQLPRRELLASVSHNVLERYVYSKPYFDREGLILAADGSDPLGFVHAGFGATADGSSLDPSLGVVSLILVVPHERRAEIAAELLSRAEAYLRQRGAETIVAGGYRGADPFYVGLWGGSEVSGISVGDNWTTDLFLANGYRPEFSSIVMHRNLMGFRPRVDRQQMQIRRRFNIEARLDPPVRNWWQACTYGEATRTQFALVAKGGDSAGNLVLWEIDPLAGSWGVQACGILELTIGEENEWENTATFLLSESLRQLQSHGITLVEVHCRADQKRQIALYQSLQFEAVDETVSLQKRPASENSG